MSFAVLDMIKGTLETDVLGSTALLILLVIFVAAVLLWKAGVPSSMFFLVMAPLIIEVAKRGLAPTYLLSSIILIMGVLLAVAYVKLFR